MTNIAIEEVQLREATVEHLHPQLYHPKQVTQKPVNFRIKSMPMEAHEKENKVQLVALKHCRLLVPSKQLLLTLLHLSWLVKELIMEARTTSMTRLISCRTCSKWLNQVNDRIQVYFVYK